MSEIKRKQRQSMNNETSENNCSMSEAERLEREKCLQIIEGYRPLDDDFMRELFRDDIPFQMFQGGRYVYRTTPHKP